MANKKISDLTALGGNFSANDIFEVSKWTGSAYLSRYITGAEIISSIGSSNIGNSDLTIDSAGDRKLIMNGALATDRFVVRNSADTGDLFYIGGDGVSEFDSTVLNGENIKWNYNGTKQVSIVNTSTAGVFRVHDNSGIVYDLDARSSAKFYKPIEVEGGSSKVVVTNTENFTVQNSVTTNSRIKMNPQSSGGILDVDASGTRVIRLDARSGQGAVQVMTLGGAPTSLTDGFKMYSLDIVAGNAAPHFKSEAGDVVKLYKEAALTASDGTTLANVITRMDELEGRLQNIGLLT